MHVHGDGTNNAVRTELTGSNVAEGIANYRLNEQGALLASAARTSNTLAPNVTNYNARGIVIALSVTVAPGAETLTIAVDAKIGAVQRNIANFPAISGTGTHLFVLYPGAVETNAGTNVHVQGLPLPRSFGVLVAHSGAGSWTYSLDYALIL